MDGEHRRRAEAASPTISPTVRSASVLPFVVIGSRLERRPDREVYFIQGVETALVKIGVSNFAAERVVALQAMSPDYLLILGVIVSTAAEALERELHGRFAHLRRHGEWFTPGRDLMDFIAANATGPRSTTVNGRTLPAEEDLTEPERAVRRAPMKGRAMRDKIAAYKAARGLT